jgi:glycosyltransferase involved in cell wall biosynthesis
LLKHTTASNTTFNKAKPILMIINADTSKQTKPPADRTKERLADYTALKEAVQADVLDWNDIAAHRWARLCAKVAGKGTALAALAFTRRRHYQLFYCDSENNGLALALFFKLSRTKRPLVMIGHRITPPKKAILFKRLKVHTHISTLFLHSSMQYDKAIHQLGIPAHKLKLLPYQVDTKFWKIENSSPTPIKPDARPYICTAGLEFRDYPTLVEAVRGLDVDLHIATGSKWSKRADTTRLVELPPNVTVNNYPTYSDLRDLYAGSRFIVVSLYEVDFQAGITVIVEAMAMGKAVIVTHSEGQSDTVIDRRKVTRKVNRPTLGKFNFMYGDEDFTAPTGFYVSSGNPVELRRAIQHLLTQPEQAEQLGANSRRMVETLLSVEQFAARIRRTLFDHLDTPLEDTLPFNREVVGATLTADERR